MKSFRSTLIDYSINARLAHIECKCTEASRWDSAAASRKTTHGKSFSRLYRRTQPVHNIRDRSDRRGHTGRQPAARGTDALAANSAVVEAVAEEPAGVRWGEVRRHSGGLFLAQLRRPARVIAFPLVVAKRKYRGWRPRAGFDPKRTFSSFDHVVGATPQGQRNR